MEQNNQPAEAVQDGNGSSSMAAADDLIGFAYTNRHYGNWPKDREEYAACVRAVRAMPRKRRSAKVLDILRTAKGYANEARNC